MSKYFDDVVRSRAVKSPPLVELPKFPTLVEKPVPKAPPTSTSSDAAPAVRTADPQGNTHMEWCSSVHAIESALLRSRFPKSHSLPAAEESYRALRTRLLRLNASTNVRSVQITSAIAGEGKTTTAFNLAVSCAQLYEMSVLLVDADLRSRGLSRSLDLAERPGLAEVLSGQIEPQKAILGTETSNLYVLPAGKAEIAPPELLADHRLREFMTWSNKTFKLIIVDSPPVLGLSDSELISACCDGVLMVIGARRVEREILKKTTLQLDQKKLLGFVYNAAHQAKQDSSYYYGSDPAVTRG